MLPFARPGHHPWREGIREKGTMAGVSVPFNIWFAVTLHFVPNNRAAESFLPVGIYFNYKMPLAILKTPN